MIKTRLINMKWPQGRGFALKVDKGENRRRQTCRVTCVTRWAYIQDRKCGSICCFCDPDLHYSTRFLETGSPKCWLVGKTSLTSIQLIHPSGQTSREVLQRVYQTTDWNIVIIISLSYITSFLQHKNRSITMITIFLNVNIQYLLHFQINLFLIYCVVVIFPPKENKNKKVPMRVV